MNYFEINMREFLNLFSNLIENGKLLNKHEIKLISYYDLLILIK